ncbi:hypothetical protein [Pseudomonas soli]|uniref:hypothetical protein n=1 Tax=Pseudomonas soli TaxID=1306993 RepID=UPI0003C7AD4A|nr:hypothetical protein O165_006425 [Pseudomonas soli]
MIGEPVPNQRAAVLAKLNASIDAFFQAGGAVQELPSFEYIPHRPHRDLEVIKASAEAQPETRGLKRQQRIDELRKLARTMTYAQAMAHTGMSQTALYRAAVDGCFRFQPDPNRGKGNVGKSNTDPVKDKALAERIVAMRDVGITMAQVCRRLEISFTVVHRIMRLFDITFPTTAEKRAQRRA